MGDFLITVVVVLGVVFAILMMLGVAMFIGHGLTSVARMLDKGCGDEARERHDD